MKNIMIKDLIDKLDRINCVVSECRQKLDDDIKTSRLPTSITVGEETAEDILMFLTEYKNLILNTEVEIEV